mgnify:FL=1
MDLAVADLDVYKSNACSLPDNSADIMVKKKSQDPAGQSLTLSDFFAASRTRSDRWAQLNVLARAWAAAASRGQSTGALKADATRALEELAPLEDFWAYPGIRLLSALHKCIAADDAAGAGRLASDLNAAMASGAYHHDAAAWDPSEDAEIAATDFMPPSLATGEKRRPYFEVLSVTPHLKFSRATKSARSKRHGLANH